MEEGDPDLFFNDLGTSVGGEEDAAPIPLPGAVDNAISGMLEEANTIKALREVVDIDDDNSLAPENVPATADNSNRLLSTKWGHDGFCFRRSQNFGSTWAKLNFSVDATCHGYYVQLFKGFFPKQLLQNVIDIVNEKMDGDEEVVYGEFISWIGIWVLMSKVDGVDQCLFWSTKNVNAFDGAPFCLTPFMSCRCFEKILYNLGYTKEGPPQYQDRFWEVQTMLQMWNENMRTNFLPSWINCIDELMSKWINEYMCPGFMYVPRKPWKFGNEYHDAGCADSNIIWASLHSGGGQKSGRVSISRDLCIITTNSVT